jgi:hypothetical protein
MKAKIITALIVISFNLNALALDTLSVDTVSLHSVKEITNVNSSDKHLVIEDTVKVTVILQKEKVVEKPKGDFTKKLIIALVILFIVLAIFNAKRNKNLDI